MVEYDFSDVVTAMDTLNAVSEECEDSPETAVGFIHDVLSIQTEPETIGRVNLFKGEDAIVRSMQWSLVNHGDECPEDCIENLLDEFGNNLWMCDTSTITASGIKTVFERIDTMFPYSQTVLQAHPLVLMAVNAQHEVRNAESTAVFNEDGMQAAIRFYRLQENTGSAQNVLLHELGHLLHMYIAKSVHGVPDSYLDFMKSLGADAANLTSEQLPELFADCFLMAVNSQYKDSDDPFLAVSPKVKELCFEYMRGIFKSLEVQA